MNFSETRIKQYKVGVLISGESRRHIESEVLEMVSDQLRDQIESQVTGQVWEGVCWWVRELQ